MEAGTHQPEKKEKRVTFVQRLTEEPAPALSLLPACGGERTVVKKTWDPKVESHVEYGDYEPGAYFQSSTWIAQLGARQG